MKTSRIPIVLASAGLALGLVACGSSAKSSTSPTPGGAASGGATTPAATTPVATTPVATTPAAGDSSAAAPTSTDTITIKNFAFGQPLTVKPGQTIKVVNADSAPHTVTADDGKSFDAPAAANGGTGSFTAPTKPGTYAFHCTVHPMMHGTLIVAA